MNIMYVLPAIATAIRKEATASQVSTTCSLQAMPEFYWRLTYDGYLEVSLTLQEWRFHLDGDLPVHVVQRGIPSIPTCTAMSSKNDTTTSSNTEERPTKKRRLLPPRKAKKQQPQQQKPQHQRKPLHLLPSGLEDGSHP